MDTKQRDVASKNRGSDIRANKIENRHKIYYIVMALVIAVSAVIMIINGDNYALHTRRFYTGAAVKIDKVEYSKSGVIELESCTLDNKDELIIKVKGIGRGDTKATYYYTATFPNGESGNYTYEVNYHIGLFNTIIDKTNYNLSTYVYWIIMFIALLFVIEIFTVIEFVSYWKQGLFSQNMITCGSVVIFVGVLILFLIYKMLNNVVYTIMAFIGIINDIGYELLLALFPFMLFMSVGLFISNIWLIRHEGRRFVNTLGIIFAVMWFAGTCLGVGPIIINSGSVDKMYLSLIKYQPVVIIQRTIVYLLCYFESMFIATVVCSYLAVKYKAAFNRDYIIILGCAIRKDGSLTPLLKGRVDAALNFERAQFEATGKHAKFVPSGGQGSDEIISEGEAMKRYILSQGVEENRVLCEGQSRNTYENMKFSREVIEKDCGNIKDKNIGFSTTNYHVFRGYVLAGKCGFEAKGISAKTKLYFYPNAFLREFIGLLVDKKVMHALTILVVLAFFIGLNLLSVF